MNCHILPETGRFTSDLGSRSLLLYDPWYCSAVWCLLLLGNRNNETSNVAVDKNRKSKFMSFFDCLKMIWHKIPRNHWFEIRETNNDTWHFNIKHNKNKIIIIGQWKRAHNEPFVVPSHKKYQYLSLTLAILTVEWQWPIILHVFYWTQYGKL